VAAGWFGGADDRSGVTLVPSKNEKGAQWWTAAALQEVKSFLKLYPGANGQWLPERKHALLMLILRHQAEALIGIASESHIATTVALMVHFSERPLLSIGVHIGEHIATRQRRIFWCLFSA
jgi:hypothetical protein